MVSIGVVDFGERMTVLYAYDMDMSSMPCGEDPPVRSFLSTTDPHKIHRARGGCSACPFWTPLLGSESDSGYTAHVLTTSGDTE